MTTRKNGTADSPEQRGPDEARVYEMAAILRLDPRRLSAAIAAFGPLPVDGQEKMIWHLYRLYGDFQFANASSRVTASQARAHLLKSARAIKRALSLLGVDAASAAPSLLRDFLPGTSPATRLANVNIDTDGRVAQFHLERIVGTDRRECVAEAIVRMVWLHEQATAAARAAESVRPQRGGPRRRPTAKGAMIRQTIDVYATMRALFPESGRPPAMGAPMLRFVQAAAMLCGVSVSETALAEVWRVRKREPNSI